MFEQPVQVARLVRDLADRAQVATQRSWKRPYGVGVLSAGHDKTGAHLFYNCPSGAYYDYKAMAIGARSQVHPWRHAFSGEPAGQHLCRGFAWPRQSRYVPKPPLEQRCERAVCKDDEDEAKRALGCKVI